MFTDGNSGVTMPVAPIGYGGYGNNGIFGNGDLGGFVLGLLFGGLGGWGGFGGFGGGWGGMMGMDAMMLAPYFFNTQTQNDVNRGFDTQNLSAQISSVQGSVDALGTRGQLSDIQQSISAGFANAEVANCGRAMDAMQTAYNNQIADMNQRFTLATAVDDRLDNLAMSLQKCCCDNELATVRTQGIVQSEAAQNRYENANNTRDIITNATANTQAILDKLCQLEIDGLKERNSELQTQVALQNLSASQAQQTAALQADNAAQTAALIQRIAPYPQPSFIVGNPYGYPYNNGYGNCGCGCGYN